MNPLFKPVLVIVLIVWAIVLINMVHR